MGDRSAIGWTDATWNPTVGCSLESPGCSGCYAMREAARLARMGVTRYAGLTVETKTGPVWTGEIRTAPDATLTQPLRWRAPRRVFVNSMSDLFHPDVGFGTVMRVLHVMAHCPHHTFQVLTKRPDRMLAFVQQWAADKHPRGRRALYINMLEDMGTPPVGYVVPSYDEEDSNSMRWWADTLPNVWLGTSAEDQVRYDERSPAMAAIHDLGWRTWCSAEPLLGPLDLHGQSWVEWLVAGGESGPRARPPHVAWFRDLRDQCAVAATPFFFKQWGEWEPTRSHHDASSLVIQEAAGTELISRCRLVARDGRLHVADAEDFADQTPFTNNDDACWMLRVGKRRAGNVLDGMQHEAWPA